MRLPEITEVQRLVLKPGDQLVLRVDTRLDAQTAQMLRERVRQTLHLSPDIGIVILDQGISLEVVEGP